MQKRFALIVAVHRYKHLPAEAQLPGADADGTTMAALTSSLGFETVVLRDSDLGFGGGSADAVLEQLDTWGRSLSPGDQATLFFHFSGHGARINDRYYMLLPQVPASITELTRVDIGTRGILGEKVIFDTVGRWPGAARTFATFDSCQIQPEGSGARVASRFIADPTPVGVPELGENTVAFYSTHPLSTAQELQGTGKQRMHGGRYTMALSAVIQEKIRNGKRIVADDQLNVEIAEKMEVQARAMLTPDELVALDAQYPTRYGKPMVLVDEDDYKVLRIAQLKHSFEENLEAKRYSRDSGPVGQNCDDIVLSLAALLQNGFDNDELRVLVGRLEAAKSAEKLAQWEARAALLLKQAKVFDRREEWWAVAMHFQLANRVCREADEALERLAKKEEGLAYAAVKTQSSIAACVEFLHRFPGSTQVDAVRQLYSELRWRELTVPEAVAASEPEVGIDACRAFLADPHVIAPLREDAAQHLATLEQRLQQVREADSPQDVASELAANASSLEVQACDLTMSPIPNEGVSEVGPVSTESIPAGEVRSENSPRDGSLARGRTKRWALLLSLAVIMLACGGYAVIFLNRSGESQSVVGAAHVEFRDTLAGGLEGPEMVVIPPGTFWQGSPPNERLTGFDEVQRQVKVNYSFAVSKFPITFDEWTQCVQSGGCSRNPNPGDEGWGRGRHPVINVSYDDAIQYIDWLNSKLLVKEQKYRLLSEAEWEYVARGNTNGGPQSPPFERLMRPDGSFSDGTCIDSSQANFNGSEDYPGCWAILWRNREKTVEVGSLESANPFGVWDMTGNVWQWVADCYYKYYDDPRVPRTLSAADGGAVKGCSADDRRVQRGGAWNTDPALLRVARRNNVPLGERKKNAGFRIARTLP